MQGNLNPSAQMAIASVIPPQQAPVGTVTTNWIDMRNFFAALAAVNVGVIGAGGTIDAKIEQATDANGAGAKAIIGSSITQLVKAGGDNRQVVINLRQEDMDKNSGYRFARLSVSVATSASFLSAMLIGHDARYGAGTANQSSAVAETVS